MVKGRFVGMVGLVLLLAAIPVQATFIPGEGTQVVRVRASDGLNTGGLVFVVPPGGPGGPSLPPGSGIIRGLDGDVIAKVNGLELSNGISQSVTLGFHVVAGPNPTNVMIETVLLSFAPIVNPMAFATAGVTLTDNDGDGASLTGLYAGNQAYQARYNTAPAITFAELLDPVIAAADSTAVLADREPAIGKTMILATVDSIQASFNFTLSANDQASGTSRFDVPEPAALVLMGLGCIPLMRRRR